MTAVAGAPVLVGVDGSRRGLDAVEAAAAEAALRHRSLRIVHAFAWPTPSTAVPPGVAGLSLQTFREGAEEIVAEAVLLAGKVAPDVPTGSHVVNGSPSQVLCAGGRRAALLVLGDRGAGGIPGLRIGSVALHAATHGACPVLVVRGNRANDGPVVVGIDGSRASAAVLAFAAAAADCLGVPLRVVHVWTGRDTPRGPRTNRYDRMGDADRLLSTVLYDHLTQDEAERAEREILHDRDAGHALVVLSSQSSLMVVAARTDRTGDGPFGETTRALIGRTACPLAVLPCCDEDIGASHGW